MLILQIAGGILLALFILLVLYLLIEGLCS